MGKKGIILILGDVMLDQYVIGAYNRRSPEADIPILDYKKEIFKLGGAANVALNLKALKRNPVLISVLGDDKTGEKIKKLCGKSGIKIISKKDKSRPTTLKTRYVDKDFKQFLRLDRELTKSISPAYQSWVLHTIQKMQKTENIDAIILQDYNKGVITQSIIKFIQSIRKTHEIPVFVDPKKTHFKALSKSTLFKPNVKELEAFLGQKIKIQAEYIFKKLSNSGLLKNDICVITLGSEGIFYHSEGKYGIIKGQKVLKADVSGAGDTVLSVLTHLYLNGIDPADNIAIANKSGAYVCEISGISSVPLAVVNKFICELTK